jgi:hypothetical protein
MHISVLRRVLRTKSSLTPSAARLFLGKGVTGDCNEDDDVDDDLIRPPPPPPAPELAAALLLLGVVLPTPPLLSAINANCNEEGVVTMVGVLGRVVGVLGRGGKELDRVVVVVVVVDDVGVLGRDMLVPLGVLGRGDSKRLRELRMLLLLSSMDVGDGRYKGGTKEARPGGSGLRRREDDDHVVLVLIPLVGVDDRDMLLLV